MIGGVGMGGESGDGRGGRGWEGRVRNGEEGGDGRRGWEWEGRVGSGYLPFMHDCKHLHSCQLGPGWSAQDLNKT